MGLGERGDGRVVVDEGRDPYPVGQQLTQRHALQRDVDRAARAACFEVDHARHADADGVGRAGVLDRLGELVDERVAVGEDRGAQDRLGEHAVLEDGDRDLGPADIDADQAIAHAVHVSDVVRSPGGRRPRAGGAPPGRRRRGVHGPRRPLVPVDDARRAHVRAQRGRRRGRRAGDLAGRAAGPRPLRGALVAAHLGLQHPRQPRPHARRARAALGARSPRSPARRATASSPPSTPIASSARGTGAGAWAAPPVRWWEEPERALASDEAVERIESEIAKLPEMQRMVITMRDVEGLSSEEVRSALDDLRDQSTGPSAPRAIEGAGGPRGLLRRCLTCSHDSSAAAAAIRASPARSWSSWSPTTSRTRCRPPIARASTRTSPAARAARCTCARCARCSSSSASSPPTRSRLRPRPSCWRPSATGRRDGPSA